jgi:hypothetical protein
MTAQRNNKIAGPAPHEGYTAKVNTTDVAAETTAIA